MPSPITLTTSPVRAARLAQESVKELKRLEGARQEPRVSKTFTVNPLQNVAEAISGSDFRARRLESALR